MSSEIKHFVYFSPPEGEQQEIGSYFEPIDNAIARWKRKHGKKIGS